MNNLFSLALEMDNKTFVVFSSTPNGFQIFYPSELKIPNTLVAEELDLIPAEAVYRDGIIREKKWGELYSKQQFQGGGRLWVTFKKPNSGYGHIFTLIIGNNGNSLAQILCGDKKTNIIRTFDSNFYSEYAPDGPRADIEIISQYKESFLTLFLKIAELSGSTPKYLHFDSCGQFLKSKHLQKKNFEYERFQDASATVIFGTHKNGVQAAIKIINIVSEFDMNKYNESNSTMISLIEQIPNYVSETFLRVPLNKKLPTLQELAEFLKKLYSQLESKKPIPTFK